MKNKKLGLALSLLVVFIYAGIAAAATAPVPVYKGIIGEGLGYPGQTAVDFKNNLFVAYPQQQVVRMFSSEGVLVKTFDGNGLLKRPTSVAADLTGKVFVGDETRVAVLNQQDLGYLKYLGATQGEFLSVQGIALYNPYNYDPATEPVYMMPDADNTPLILVVDSAANAAYIKAYRLQGSDYQQAAQFVLPSSALCTGITVDNNSKRVIITDKINSQVYEYNLKDFSLARTYNYKGNIMLGKGKVADLVGAAVDTAGRLYFALGYNSYVQVNDRDNAGAKLAVIGAPGKGAGQMMHPAGVLIDFKKRLIVSDHENRRLLVFQLDAAPSTPYAAPDKPVLLEPINLMTGSQPPLKITNLYEANGSQVDYVIEVATDQNFAALVQTFNGTADPGVASATIADWGAVSLNASRQYFWRAKAKNHTLPLMESDWSEVGAFYVNTALSNSAPAAPLLTAPADKTPVDAETFLEWSAAQDPDVFDAHNYTVEILTKSNQPVLLTASAPVAETKIMLKAFPGYGDLKEGHVYYWRVKAADSFGAASPYSAMRTFKLVPTGINVKGQPGAAVYTGGNDAYLGQFRGVIPPEGQLVVELSAGRRVVRVVKEGLNPYYNSVVVKALKLQNINAVQKPAVAPADYTALAAPQAVVLAGDYRPQGARPFVVDWDDDDKKELLVGENNGNLSLLEPAGSQGGKFKPPVLLTNIGSAAAPFVVDWDNDGTKDILVGEGTGLLRRYVSKEKLAAGEFSYLQTWDGVNISVPGPAAPWVVDWNNDGKKDLLLGAGDGLVYLYINNNEWGSDENPILEFQGAVPITDRSNGLQTNLTADLARKNAAPLACYWDADGYMDLLVGYDDGQVYWFKNEPAAADPRSPVFYYDTTTTLKSNEGKGLQDYLGAGASPFLVMWKWSADAKFDLFLGSDNQGLWTADK